LERDGNDQNMATREKTGKEARSEVASGAERGSHRNSHRRAVLLGRKILSQQDTGRISSSGCFEGIGFDTV
jgi:hypothetical protein